jgi:hypothetical protein
MAAPSVKQRLAALRHLFDWLVNGQLMALNPATPSAGLGTLSPAGKRRCSILRKHASCSTASMSQAMPGCAIGRCSR